MATPNPIKIIEVTQVSPSSTSPNSATDFSLPLTLFDTIWLKFHPVERLFFYQFTDSTTPTFFFYSTILPKLKHSLSLTLLHFLPLAGRLKWPSHAPKPTILYTPNDGGVPFTVAESNADFNHLSSNETLEAVELHPYIPNLPISDDIASIIALQITLFPNLGFCIGITAHHAILDGKTATMFIKAWAYICKQDQENPSLLPEEQTPFFDRTVIRDPNGLDMVYLNNWLDMEAKLHPDSNPRNLKLLPFGANIEGLVRATFELSRADIKKLRERVLSMLNKVDEEEKKASKSIHLSSFVLTLAYVLVCMVKAKGVESTRKVQFGFTADCRTRLDPPVPVNYFGNCVGVYYMVVLEARAIMEENGITILA